MPILEPIEEKDLDLAGKFRQDHPRSPEERPFVPEKEDPRGSAAEKKESAYEKILSKVRNSSHLESDEHGVRRDAVDFMHKTDAESQIQHLVDVAFQKGIPHAVKVARHLEDNYVLDIFHDRLLADELREALLKKGLIKEA